MKLSDILLKELPRTSPRTVKLLNSLGVSTYFDLLNYVPFRYEDYSRNISIREFETGQPMGTLGLAGGESSLKEGDTVSLKGYIEKFDNVYTRSRITMQKMHLSDETGSMIISWFNQPFLAKVLLKGLRVGLAGTVKMYKGGLTFFPSEYEILGDVRAETIHTGRLVPVYSQTRGLSAKTIREKVYFLIKEYVEQVNEMLPLEILKKYQLEEEVEAYKQIHFPESMEKAEAARRRLAFDELFITQLSSQMLKKEWQKDILREPFEVREYETALNAYMANLPFVLTGAQQRSIAEILEDLGREVPMNRLLQGDVGSGKTVVASVAMYIAFLNKKKSLLMAPTEILAQQHFVSLQKLFELVKGDKPRVVLLTGNSKPKKEELVAADVVVGTHALVAEKISFDDVGLIIIDEQHKFGVSQRAKLKDKATDPHFLSMTATPIPRTVALTLYGELDMSIIDEMPTGRKMVKTYVTPSTKRMDAYEWIKKELAAHHSQVFIVCPLIEESEQESMKSIKAAQVEYDYLQKEVFTGLKMGLLHGKMKPAEKNDMMKAFEKHEIDILVSTPVVEVGIDVPNATVIVIEAAERFGLAQLHQLRGRVGRSDKQSYCLLFTEQAGSKERLTYFSTHHNGFELAEYDLHHRGTGNIFGTAQHGAVNLRVASLLDKELIDETREAVLKYLEELKSEEFHEELQLRIELSKPELIARD